MSHLVERKVLQYLAETGQYYDNLGEVPFDILKSIVNAHQKIISNPDDFPNAMMEKIFDAYPYFVVAMADRGL